MTSSLLLLFLCSDLTAGVGQLDSDLLGSLDDFGAFLDEMRGTRELTL